MRFLSSRRAAVSALVTVLCAACDDAPQAGPRTPGSDRARARAGLVQSYQPQPDGHLTTKQVDAYLGVQEALRTRPAVPRRSPKPAGLSDEIEGASPDLGVARERNLNVEEYLWVKERILEGDAAVLTARLNGDTLAAVEKTLAELRSRREGAADAASRTLMDEQIVVFEAEAERLRRESKEREPESVRFNVRLLEPYRARLAGLAGELAKPAAAAAPAPPGAPSSSAASSTAATASAVPQSTRVP